MNLSVKAALAAIAGSSKDRTAFMKQYGIAEVPKAGGRRGRDGNPVSDSTKNKSAIAAFVLNAYSAARKADTTFVGEVPTPAVIWR